ncbi:MAG: hypothetical protein SOZ27_00940 [Spirochaetia bacterium]|nr:hypothetical protein [Spirochaetia bacterium]
MYIFYFLSVASLLMAGLILSSELLGKKISFFFDFTKFTKTYPLFLLILGIAVLLIGAFKFAISVGNAGIGIPVVGDFFPAIGGLIGGILLILYYAANKNGEDAAETVEVIGEETDENNIKSRLNKIKNLAMTYRGIIGLVLIAVAVIHLFVPQILFF